jgi:ATP-dependent Clp protease ATP-binding subunit ClpA
MFERFSTAARRVVFVARWEAGFVGSKMIDSEHLLLGLMRIDPTTLQAIAQPVTVTSVREAAVKWHVPEDKLPTSVDLPISLDVQQTFENAATLADAHRSSLVRTEHLLPALMAMKASHAAVILEGVEASSSRLEQLASEIPGHGNQEGEPLSGTDLALLMST